MQMLFYGGVALWIRGTQQHVSVDICLVEGSLPYIFGINQRMH